MNCSRNNCNQTADHFHVGAINGKNPALCNTCYKEWKAISEKTRLQYVAQLSLLQNEFLAVYDTTSLMETESVSEPEFFVNLTDAWKVDSPVTVETLPTVISEDRTDSEIPLPSAPNPVPEVTEPAPVIVLSESELETNIGLSDS